MALRLAALALLGVAFLVAAPADAKTRALVIGVNAYPGILVNGVGGQRDLRGAVNDARNMQAALTEHFDVRPDEIRLLVDGDASRDNILKAFREWLIDGTAEGDRAIFYFAGHGAQVVDEDGDEGDDKFDEVLVPGDAKGELVGSDAGLTGFIADDEIQALLAELAGREVLMIVDACHSGTITRGALDARQSGAADSTLAARTLTPNGPVGAAAALADLTTRSAHRVGTRLIEVVADEPEKPTIDAPALLAVWTAAASAQLAMEDLELGGEQGLFTNRFIKGIAEGTADLDGSGRITASELLAFLRAESDAYCQTYRCGPGGLTPTLEAYVGYDGTTLAEYHVVGEDTTIASSDDLPALGYFGAGKVTVTLSGGGSMRYGDPLQLKIVSDYSGELIVLDVRDDGTTVQLFPNTPSLAVGVPAVIAAGETRYLPGDEDPFVLVPDARGSGRIVVLVVDYHAAVAALTGRYLDLEPIPAAGDYIAELARSLNSALSLPAGSEDALARAATGAVMLRAEAPYVIN